MKSSETIAQLHASSDSVLEDRSNRSDSLERELGGYDESSAEDVYKGVPEVNLNSAEFNSITEGLMRKKTKDAVPAETPNNHFDNFLKEHIVEVNNQKVNISYMFIINIIIFENTSLNYCR